MASVNGLASAMSLVILTAKDSQVTDFWLLEGLANHAARLERGSRCAQIHKSRWGLYEYRTPECPMQARYHSKSQAGVDATCGTRSLNA